MVDLVIIGAGVAGLCAAATAADHGLDTLVVEHMAPGGQVATAERIDNVPGFPDGIAGYELGPLLQGQAEAKGAAFLFETATAVEPDGSGFRIRCGGQVLDAAAVILAAGSRHRELGIPGEAALRGRGVSHCASCDGPLLRGKPAVVVGGGDYAFDEAIVLAEHASEVTILHRGEHPRAQRAAVKRVAATPNIRLRAGAEVVAVLGESGVSGVAFRAGGAEETLSCAGVFIFAGLVPNSEFLRGVVELDAGGRVLVDPMLRSSRPGLFAAGDIRAQSSGMLASVAGDGATAAVAAARHLRGG
ncbi:NAD(P)/FAD-dependent oxidoreductase [Roseomonas sp. BN140053]|uniref:NAD(P)/FAD-dependent oxidoreductase n=1 Tax=Roseomonas sp. BN140053 TaxID=3391898 RepID=UPI0039EC1571